MALPNFTFIKPKRSVARVFLHCSASDNKGHDDVQVMKRWHMDPPPAGRGWSDVGYHFFIKKDGTIQRGRPLESVPAAQANHNAGTIAICCHGLDVAAFTPAQFASLRDLCGQIDDAYGASGSGGRVTFHGHCEVSAKSCPVFDYKRVLSLDKFGRMGRLGTVSRPALAVNDNKPDWKMPLKKVA
jgi:hypothetical protein